jgi:hypothetical protein
MMDAIFLCDALPLPRSNEKNVQVFIPNSLYTVDGEADDMKQRGNSSVKSSVSQMATNNLGVNSILLRIFFLKKEQMENI